MTTAIVAGSARCLWSDLARASAHAPDAQLVAVNLTGLFLPTVLHLVSLHPEILGRIVQLRRSMDCVLNPAHEVVQTHSHVPGPGVDRAWPDITPEGSSALFAVRVALALGFDRVIVAGAPLDSSGRFFDDPRPSARWDWTGADGDPYRAAWIRCASEEFEGRVTSCSGWTAQLLGGPA